MSKNNIILGAGIAGLGAAYALKQRGEESIVLEKDDTYGGLCGNFTINGFRFDRFVHFSFAKDETVNRIFAEGASDVYRHVPNAYNLYHGLWLKHPAQNNLYPLPQEMKDAVVRDFKARPTDVDSSSIKNYDQWLRLQFGNYFAEHFPIPYTKKYWMTEASDLETRWMGSREGSRLYQPSVEEVIEGCKTKETPVTYYSKEMRYPKRGGYKQYLSALAKDQDIRCNQKVVEIDAQAKTVKTADGNSYRYDRLISSLPLPEVIKAQKITPPRKYFTMLKSTLLHLWLSSIGGLQDKEHTSLSLVVHLRRRHSSCSYLQPVAKVTRQCARWLFIPADGDLLRTRQIYR